MMNLYGLGGLGALADDVAGFLAANPAPSSAQVADFLKLYPDANDRTTQAQALVAGGVDPSVIASATQFLSTSGKLKSSTIWGMLAVASAAASGYHGYKRNNSIGWASWWFFMGGVFPVFTPVIAAAQGFGKRKGA